MIIQSNINFVKDIDTPTVSKPSFNHNSDTLSIQVSGDFTSGLIHIEGRMNKAGNWVSLAGINLNDFNAVRNGITKAGLYEFSVVSVRELRARVEAISGGKVSVFGSIISTEET